MIKERKYVSCYVRGRKQQSIKMKAAKVRNEYSPPSHCLTSVLSAQGGGYSTNVYTGRLRPEVQPPTLLYTIFHEKGTSYTFY